jgi:hypothetical protein
VAGYREFQTGEVLTAANVNTFLMEQAVLTFPDAAARTAALADVLREGILTYNEDTAQLEVYDGTAFVVAAPAPPAGIGSNVVQTVKTDTFSTTSGTFTTVTGLTATITPSSASSKVLVVAYVNGSTSSSTNDNLFLRLSGGGSDAFVGDAEGSTTRAAGWVRQSASDFFIADNSVSWTVSYLSSPSTTSPVTYEVEAAATQGTGFINRNGSASTDNKRGRLASSITVIEVAV